MTTPGEDFLERWLAVFIVVTTHMSVDIYIKDSVSDTYPNFQNHSYLHSTQVEAAGLGFLGLSAQGFVTCLSVVAPSPRLVSAPFLPFTLQSAPAP